MAMALAARGDFLVTSTTGVVTALGVAAFAAVFLTGLETVVVTDLAAVLTGTIFLATGGFEVFNFETTAFWGTVLDWVTALDEATGFFAEIGFLTAAAFLTTTAFLAGFAVGLAAAFFTGLGFLMVTFF